MNQYRPPLRPVVLAVAAASLWVATARAALLVSRLTPPSELFLSGQAAPVIARFVPGQRFDLQATLRPDDATRTITSAPFSIDGKLVDGSVALRHCSTGIDRHPGQCRDCHHARGNRSEAGHAHLQRQRHTKRWPDRYRDRKL